MEYTKNTIQNQNGKHLAPFEHGDVSVLNDAGYSNREIAKRLELVHHQTIINKLKHGTTIQFKTERKPNTVYFPETDQAIYGQKKRQIAVEIRRRVVDKSIAEHP